MLTYYTLTILAHAHKVSVSFKSGSHGYIGPGVNRSINKLLINEKFVRNSKCVGKSILKWFGCKNVYISVTHLYGQLGHSWDWVG